MAQVKLRFKGTNGAKVVASRNLQLTTKKGGGLSQKTLDGTMQMRYPNGEKITVSSKVAELDRLLPNYLGVSKAILDSVIFCHQDESLWPLSEPAALKKKFDEIFEAQKYTKAIDNIKQIRKTRGEQLKSLRTNEIACKENKTKADKVCQKPDLYLETTD